MSRRINTQALITNEIKKMPESLLEEVLDFTHFLRAKRGQEKNQFAKLSEFSLKKDWLRPEEDKAWLNL